LQLVPSIAEGEVNGEILRVRIHYMFGGPALTPSDPSGRVVHCAPSGLRPRYVESSAFPSIDDETGASSPGTS
jgi:hypothetical protein